MTQLQTLIAAVIAGGLIIAGTAVLAGLGWALIVAGAWVTLGAVLLYDPAPGGERRRPRASRIRAGKR